MLEGNTRDGSFIAARDAANDNAILNSYGDGDDILMFTARNLDHPYQGVYNGAVIESKVAEIIWWAVHEDLNGDSQLNINETITLHRRVLLVAPQLNDVSSPLHPLGLMDGICATGISLQQFLQNNDISVRVDANGNLVANTLADLSKRENRFGHSGGFPFPIDRTFMNGLVLQGGRQGEDVVLSHIAAFDAKLFDPQAEIRSYPLPNGEAVAVTPEDPGYAASTPIGVGTYVDLNYAGNSTLSLFSGPPNPKSRLGQNVYCTWSTHYERDGIDQDDGGSGPVDEATNGLDDDNAHGADDEAERETSPPYPFPLRGVQVTFRVRDPASQQIRQTSIESSFVPE